MVAIRSWPLHIVFHTVVHGLNSLAVCANKTNNVMFFLWAFSCFAFGGDWSVVFSAKQYG